MQIGASKIKRSTRLIRRKIVASHIKQNVKRSKAVGHSSLEKVRAQRKTRQAATLSKDTVLEDSEGSTKEETASKPDVDVGHNTRLEDVKYFTKRIYHYAKAFQMEKAESIFREMEEVGVEPNVVTYTALMRGYFLSKNNKELYRVYEKMKARQIRPTPITLGTLLTACSVEGDIKRASRILKEFQALGLSPDIVGMNALMKTCIQAGNLKMAIGVFERIEKQNLKRSVISYNTLIDGYAKLGSMEDCEALLKVGFDLKDALLEDGFKCDLHTYIALIRLSIRARNMPMALQIFSEMKNAGVQPDVVAYSMIIDGYANNGWIYRPSELLNLCLDCLWEMDKTGIQPNIYTFNSLLKVCGRIGDPAKALNIFDVIKHRGLEPNVISFGTLIDCYVKNSSRENPDIYLERCFSLVEDMKPYNLHISNEIISSLMNACAEVGNIGMARNLLRRLKDEGLRPNIVVYTTLMKVYLMSGDLSGGLRCMTMMEEQGIQPNVYALNLILEWHVNRGNRKEAFRILSDMQVRGIEHNKLTKRLIAKLERQR